MLRVTIKEQSNIVKSLAWQTLICQSHLTLNIVSAESLNDEFHFQRTFFQRLRKPLRSGGPLSNQDRMTILLDKKININSS